jgi:uncharacterized YigZ family protein
MSEDVFNTMQAPTDALYKVKGSKHYGYVFPIENVEEAKTHLEALRKKHHDARHHAYAYRLGPSGDDWRASDDGEPANSAGPPILGALKSKKVTNCLGVVVRYFGGTKLGVGGLIYAYRTATLMAIDNGEILQRFIEESITVQCPYDLIGAVMTVGEKHRARVAEQTFTDSCTVHFRVRASLHPSCYSALDNLYGCHIKD